MNRIRGKVEWPHIKSRLITQPSDIVPSGAKNSLEDAILEDDSPFHFGDHGPKAENCVCHFGHNDTPCLSNSPVTVLLSLGSKRARGVEGQMPDLAVLPMRSA